MLRLLLPFQYLFDLVCEVYEVSLQTSEALNYRSIIASFVQDLHATPLPSPPIKDQMLLVRVDAFLILYLGLDIVNGVRALNPLCISLFR